jgi:hypothetical protein
MPRPILTTYFSSLTSRLKQLSEVIPNELQTTS